MSRNITEAAAALNAAAAAYARHVEACGRGCNGKAPHCEVGGAIWRRKAAAGSAAAEERSAERAAAAAPMAGQGLLW